MIIKDSLVDSAVVDLLNDGGIGVVRTDTLYGVVARANDQAAVERVYAVKSRRPTKPPIVLIASQAQMYSPVPAEAAAFLGEVWPGPSSVIVPSEGAPSWLSRQSGAVAYRLPAAPELLELLRLTGPLIAPSANPEGGRPAQTIDQAVQYFGDKVDFYVDSGSVVSDQPSALYKLQSNGKTEQLR